MAVAGVLGRLLGLSSTIRISAQPNLKYYNQMSQQDKSDRSAVDLKKQAMIGVASDGSNSESELQRDDQQQEDEGFIKDDDESISYDSQSKRKRKHKKRSSKRSKLKRNKYSEEEFDEDDIDVIDPYEGRGYSRLKKKTENRRKSDDSESYEEPKRMQSQESQNSLEEEEIDNSNQSQEPGFRYADQEDGLPELKEANPRVEDIFEPDDMEKLVINEQSKEIVDIDIPERYIMRLRAQAQLKKRHVADLLKEIQTEDKTREAEWIYERLRLQNCLQTLNEHACKERIRLVLQELHHKHLQIMYIFYFRKKIYADCLTLELLWKIEELDQEWLVFRAKHNQLEHKLITVVKSYQDVPRELEDMLARCLDMRTLRYFEEYQRFVLAKLQQDKSQRKNGFVSQIHGRKVDDQLEKSEIFLSPQNLCANFDARMQQRKPKTPYLQPREYFERMLKSSNIDQDRNLYPLLVSDLRFQTISKYLSLELFAYPEFRKYLKDKYSKKLMVSTTPTKKGQHNIDLYSCYFPVKRINAKPLSTLKRELWILALQAKKHDLINLELMFDWEVLIPADKDRTVERDHKDTVYNEIIKYYFDITTHKSGDSWNLFRKRVIHRTLDTYFFPAFWKQVKEEMLREGEREIITAACRQLSLQLNRGPSLKEGKAIKILAMVLEGTKLGIAFVSETGQPLLSLSVTVVNDDELKMFVNDELLANYVAQHKPDMILISANCRRAQTLRKQLRRPDIFSESIYCAFGDYEVPRLVAKKQLIGEQMDDQAILEAISMARLKKNPMSEIISLWSNNIQENGILSMNLHPYQKFVDQKKLADALEKVIIEIVNLVGLDINEVKDSQYLQMQLQFVCGLGPKKTLQLLDRLHKDLPVVFRNNLLNCVSGPIVYCNCSPFLRVQTPLHRMLLERTDYKKGKQNEDQTKQVNLLEMTRIPEEWHEVTRRRITETARANSLIDMRARKGHSTLSQETIALIDIFRNPKKLEAIDWKYRQNYFDEGLVESEIRNRFKDPRDKERLMDNRETFFNLLRETPETLKRYMILPVKVLSAKNNYLNVVVPENGLFGYIRLGKQEGVEKLYQKGSFLRAVLIGFPFDEKKSREQSADEQESLKVEMALDFPHKTEDRHDCIVLCFPDIVKSIHPTIDLEKDRFDLKKETMPVLQVIEDRNVKSVRMQYRRIGHPKFKNVSAGPAIEMMKSQTVGEFIIRPSTQGAEYLTITWNFFKGVVAHIKVRCDHKAMSSVGCTYRIEDRDNRSYNSIEDMIDKHIKPMNMLVEDVVSNKKFIASPLDKIEEKVKVQMSRDSSHIYYYFGASEDYPQYFILVYMYKEKKPIKELIKVRSTGLYFHDQQFQNIRELINWFKEHLRDKEYQKYVKAYSLKK